MPVISLADIVTVWDALWLLAGITLVIMVVLIIRYESRNVKRAPPKEDGGQDLADRWG